jgi:hypothetical protein
MFVLIRLIVQLILNKINTLEKKLNHQSKRVLRAEAKPEKKGFLYVQRRLLIKHTV